MCGKAGQLTVTFWTRKIGHGFLNLFLGGSRFGNSHVYLVRIFWYGGVALAKFVGVIFHQAAGDLQGKYAEVSIGSGSLDDTTEGVEAIDSDVLRPDVEAIAAGRDIVQDDAAIAR
jgi:hypothetical protein